MKSMLSGWRTAAAVAVLGLLAPGGVARAAVSFEDYHSFSEVERQLQAWGKDNPEMKVMTIGQSAGGRALYVVRVAAPGGLDPDARPAIFVGANINGSHNAGTEAALDLLETLTTAPAGSPAAKLLETHTFYIAPALNPDAHDAIFSTPRGRRSGNGLKIDRDRDGLAGEDPADDLNGDGLITRMRIPDPAGGWLPHPEDPRIMVRADGSKERAGAFRVVTEGKDDDNDGEYNEDGADGVAPDRNFPHAFPHPEADAGPWPSYAPESKALLDFVLGRRNLMAAVIYGPANNLLAAPQSLGGGGDLGTQKFTLPPQAAQMLGFDPEGEYTIDEVWAVAKDLPFVRQNNITKEQLQQFLGAGPATKVDPDDQAWLDKIAEAYKERLKKAGLADDRPGEQYGKGGLTPWLYYQAGILPVELDVWGAPKAKKEEAKGEGDALTLDKVAAMSTDEFIALGEEKIDAFLKENKVPAQFNAKMVIGLMKGGQADPKAMVDRIKQMGGGGGGAGGGGGKGKDDAATERARDVLAWADAGAPGSFAAWTPMTLPDGTRVEVGGLDPFVQTNPPMAILKPALKAHTETVLDLAGRLPRVEVTHLDVKDLGGGVYRVRAVAGNRGPMATHTKQAVRARSHLPVQLVLRTGDGVELVTGYPEVTSDRLDGISGTVEAEWLVRAKPGTRIVVDAITENAGRAQKAVTAGQKGA